MLIEIASKKFIGDGYVTIEEKGYKVYWKGLIWEYGKKAGADTVKSVVNKYIESGNIEFKKIFGAYTIAIYCPDDKVLLFCDNSNMHGLWKGDMFVGDNVLELARAEKKTEFNQDAVDEFMFLGTVYSEMTLIKGIDYLENESFFIFENNEIKKCEKGIGTIDEESSLESYEDFFEKLAYSISDERTTLSLTGGYDSRMVLAGIYRYKDVDLFISGSEENKDVSCAKKAAKAIGKELEILSIAKPKIDEAYLEKCFLLGMGVINNFLEGPIRVNEFTDNRIQNEYSCYLTGDGGTLHKDWYWMVDLPFYHKKSVNIKRFYRQRMVCIDEMLPYGDILLNRRNNVENRLLRRLEEEKRATNTQSYDAFKYYVLAKNSTKLGYTSRSKQIKAYVPLWELELIKFSYALPRRKRFFYNQMRKVTTACSPDLAKVPTCYGTTASNKFIYMARDVFFQMLEYVKKACRLFGRKFLRKSLFCEPVVRWSIEDEVRALEITRSAMEFGRREGYIAEGISNELIPYSLVSRVLHVYMLKSYLEV